MVGKSGLGLKNWRQAWLLGGLLGAAGVVALLLALLPPYAVDMTQWKMWARTVTLEGVHNAYNGAWPETYSIYPPLTLATYWVAGQLYRLLVDPTFALGPALASAGLSYLIKMPGIGFHLLTGFVIFRASVGFCGFRVAMATAAVYLFNPAALFDLTYWGQPDSVYAFFLVLAAVGVAGGPLALGWGALAAAALAKPQAWALGPLLLLNGAVWHPRRAWARGLAAVVAVMALVLAPYALGERLPQLATLPGQMNEVAPALSANAHNLWWLLSRGNGLSIRDTSWPSGTPLPITPRTVGYALWGSATLLALAALLRSRRPAAAYEAAAFVAFAFVMLATRIHENHVFMVLPLGALAAVHRPTLWKIWAGISGMALLNLIFHDPLITAWLDNFLSPRWQRLITLGNAAAGMLLLSHWAARLLAEARSPAPPSSETGAPGRDGRE